MSFSLGGESREEQYKKAELSPEARVTHIIDRLWNRAEATPENALTHAEALVLLLYGDVAGEELVAEEMENGRYEPGGDVQALLDKRRPPEPPRMN